MLKSTLMIPVNEPVISKNAQKYVLDCLKTGWVSSAGKYINLFEEKFAQFIGVKYALTTTSGTSALHLALVSLGITSGDEVIMPDLTIISCAAAVLYTGATPVLVDVDSKTGNIDPGKIEAKITKKTKVIMVVHLYGQPADMDSIMAIAKKHNLWVLEDAAQAHGALYKGQKAGSIGDAGCFSFYGNKIITTGEGGMVITNSKKVYAQAKLLKDLAHSRKKRFVHNQIGFNYRMTNLQAALGLAQLEQVKDYLTKKAWMADQYQKRLKDLPYLELPQTLPGTKNVFWMYAVKVAKNSPILRDQLCLKLQQNGIATRDFFYPLHKQPALIKLGLFKGEKYPVSSDLSNRGFYLPSGLAITERQIKTICAQIKKIFNETAKI